MDDLHLTPNWERLGAEFGVTDTCVPFAAPGTVYASKAGGFDPVAESVVALREGPEGVHIQVSCGLFLLIEGARLSSVSEEGNEAYLELPPRFTRIPVKDPTK